MIHHQTKVGTVGTVGTPFCESAHTKPIGEFLQIAAPSVPGVPTPRQGNEPRHLSAALSGPRQPFGRPPYSLRASLACRPSVLPAVARAALQCRESAGKAP